MAYSPPRWLDRIALIVVPPASAEHTLGDLAECARSGPDYVRQLCSVLPRVVWSQVRRRVGIVGIAFLAIISGVALLALHASSGASLFAGPWGALRVAGVWAVWTIGWILSGAYGPPDKPTASNHRVFAATVVAALAVSALLGVPLVRTALGLGAAFGVVLLLAMPWVASSPPPPPLTRDTLVLHARLFQRGIWWRNARESLACVVVLLVNLRAMWQAEASQVLAANVLIAAGVIFILGFLHLRAAPRPVPPDADVRAIWQFHRRELARQRDLLRSIAWWYLMPFVPGMVMTFVSKWDTSAHGVAGATAGVIVVLVLLAFIWRLNLWGARWLDGELQKVDALEGQL